MPEDVSRDVDQLLKDREKYESWLERLEAEKDKATNQAYDRVRSDYQKRLHEVVAQLKAHGEALRSRLSDVEGRVSELEGQQGGCQEKLDEARLRRMVGEYTDDQEWQELEGRLVAELEEADRELEEARAEVHHLNEIVSQVGLDHAEPLASGADRPQPAPAPPESAAGGEQGPVAPETAGPPRSSTPQVDRRGEERPAADEQPEPDSQAIEPRPVVEGEPEALDEPFRPSLEDEIDEGFLSLEELVLEDKDPEEAMRPARHSEPPRPEPTPEPATEEGEAEVGDELAFLESLSLGPSEESSESFSFLEQHGSGTPQTIICPHCSAANDPAEWYCTECGEELPAE